MTKFLAVASVLAALGLTAGGQVLEAHAFTCSGDERGGVCWLSSVRLVDTATWRFSGVPAGTWVPFTLEGVADEVCTTCQFGRDVLVRLYYQSPGDRYWQRVDLWLRNAAPDAAQCLVAYPVRGQARIFPTGSELIVIAQRVLSCDPHVGFSWRSLTLGAAPAAPAPVPLPTLPTLPTLPPPPPPPPPPPEQACAVGSLFNCATGEPLAGCLPEGLDLAAVPRQTLPQSFGPGEDAVVLQPGHYVGSLGEGDFQDWYRIKTTYGNAFIVWVDPGNLELDVYIVHDPCGDVLAQCLAVRSASTSVAPCYPGMVCNDTGPCYLEGVCSFYIRIVRRSGSGPYKLSILTAVP